MKITIEETPGLSETEIRIACPKITEEISLIIAELRLYDCTVVGRREGCDYILGLRDILYFDTVDRRTFIYTDGEVYESPLRLCRIEEMIAGTSFIRAGKACILNLKKVQKLARLMDGRLRAELINGETLDISRSFVPFVRAKLGL